MTRSQMMAIATAYANASGQPYDSTSAGQNGIANRRMVMFAAAAKCIYDDAVALTLVSGTATYDLRSASLSRRVAKVELVTINGSPLLDYDGDQGTVSLDELRQAQPGYLGDTSGRPVRACEIPPQTLRLWPKPDQVYSNNFVAGWVLPADIDTTSGGDGTAIEFATEDCELVAIYVGMGLVEPTAATESDYERIAAFSKSAAARWDALMSRTEAMLSGPSVRGAIRGTGIQVARLG